MVEKGKRRLVAIMFADMVGYTALMQENEDRARSQRDEHRALISTQVASHDGEILQYYGDGTLSIFSSAVEAVECALAVQLALSERELIPLRIGIHAGDVVHDDDGVYGDGVNLASRIEGLAAPGGITVSGKVFDEIKNHPSISTIPLGDFQLKNVINPVSVFAISNEGLPVPERKPDPAPPTEHDRPETGADEILRNIKNKAMVQWSLAYLAGAWVLLEIIGFTSEHFLWPSVIPKAAALMAAAGLFVTLVLAWYHGEVGRQKVTGPELLMIAILLALAGGAIALFAPGGSQGPASESNSIPVTARARPSIAVLPFENMSTDSAGDAEFLALGLHDDLLTQLSKIASLDVIARTSVLQYAGTEKTISAIGRELGVGAILEGSVMQARGQVRLNVQLIDTSNDAHLWAETYDREFTLENVFAIQTDLAKQVVDELEAELAPGERSRLEEIPTENLEAYTFYRRGEEALFRLSREPGDLELAVTLLRQAVDADSAFVHAYAGLSSALCYLFLFYDRNPEHLEEARAATEEALRLNPESAEAWASRSFEHYLLYQNQEALEALQRAESIAPGLPGLLNLKAELQTRAWDFSGSLATKERAALLDPRNPEVLLGLAQAYAESDQWEEAEVVMAQLMETYPEFHEASFAMGWLKWRHTGDHRPALETLSRVPPDASVYGLRHFFEWLISPEIEDKVAALERIESPILDFGGFWWAPRELIEGWTYRDLDPTRSEIAFRRCIEISASALERMPGDPRIHASMGRAYAYLGMRDEALEAARLVKEILPITKDPVFGRDLLEGVANIYAALGMADETADALEEQFSVPGVREIPALYGPEFALVFDHPRIQGLIERYGPEEGIYEGILRGR